jgi:hypothetical protein
MCSPDRPPPPKPGFLSGNLSLVDDENGRPPSLRGPLVELDNLVEVIGQIIEPFLADEVGFIERPIPSRKGIQSTSPRAAATARTRAGSL